MATYKEFIDKVKPEFEKALRFLETEMTKMRTSRATPALVEDVEVNYLGAKYSLKQLASIASGDANQIIIQPWDPSYIEAIQVAIANSGLGMSAAVDKNVVRLSLPMLTEEYRKSLVKLLNEKAEQSRQTLRHWREDAWNKIQRAEKDKLISEDDKFRGKDALQKLIDEYAEKIKALVEKKEKELL